jgi:hypothetical protein
MMEPLSIAETPDGFAIGGQPRFATRLVKDGRHKSRAILVLCPNRHPGARRPQVAWRPDSPTNDIRHVLRDDPQLSFVHFFGRETTVFFIVMSCHVSLLVSNRCFWPS